MKNKVLRFFELGDDDVKEAYSLFQKTHDNPWSFESFQQTLITSNCLVAKSTEILGLVLFHSLFEQAEVLFVGVDPKARRQGLASKLISETINSLQARGADAIFLEVDTQNTKAKGLYLKSGFKVIDTRKNYYQKPDGQASDAYVMQYTFKDE